MKFLKPLFLTWIPLLQVLGHTFDVAVICKKEKLLIEAQWLRRFQLKTVLLCLILISLNVLPAMLGYQAYKTVSTLPEYRGKVVRTLIKKKSVPESARMTLKLAQYALGACVFVNLLTALMHPVLSETRKLTKLTLDEKHPNLARCWLPIGVYMDTFGQDAKNIAQDERIWAAMNMIVDKDMIYESPNARTRKLFVSSFVLQDKYNYDQPLPSAQ